MFPILDLHFIKLPMYGISIFSGVFVAFLLVFILCKKNHKDFNDFIIIATISITLSFIGAKLMFILVTFPIKNFFKVLKLILSQPREYLGQGFVFYGGLITGIPAYILGCKISQCKITTFFPELTIIIPLVHGFGRIGCFFAGCCYGIPYNGFMALHYHNPITAVRTDTGIFPVQLLEAFLMLSFAVIMLILHLKNKEQKPTLYLLYYSIVRFGTEFLRGDIERGSLGNLATSQWISIVLFISVIAFMIIYSMIQKHRKANTKVISEEISGTEPSHQ